MPFGQQAHGKGTLEGIFATARTNIPAAIGDRCAFFSKLLWTLVKSLSNPSQTRYPLGHHAIKKEGVMDDERGDATEEVDMTEAEGEIEKS